MSSFSMDIPKINEEDLQDTKNIKAIRDYLIMLNDQLRYALNNLSFDENFDASSGEVFKKIARKIEMVAEEITLYAKKGELSSLISLEPDTITISNKLATAVEQTQVGNTITTTYKYDGVQFCVDVTADAVQEHNAQDAIKSAWGRSVTVNEDAGSLSLN